MSVKTKRPWSCDNTKTQWLYQNLKSAAAFTCLRLSERCKATYYGGYGKGDSASLFMSLDTFLRLKQAETDLGLTRQEVIALFGYELEYFFREQHGHKNVSIKISRFRVSVRFNNK